MFENVVCEMSAILSRPQCVKCAPSSQSHPACSRLSWYLTDPRYWDDETYCCIVEALGLLDMESIASWQN